MWWPKGIDEALYGTNFDIPVSQVDFFATFADMLGYPLPKASACVYSYNSKNENVHGQDATKIGRPGLYPNHEQSPNPGATWLEDMKTWNWSDPAKNIFDAKVQIRAGKGQLIDKEVQVIGMDRLEGWLTQEDLTGYIVGWDGCMAEDSISFKSAFTATLKKTRTETSEDGSEKTYHIFENSLKTTHTQVQAGKLGDLSIRFGRYKLIRFNVPKDGRTGPTRQHLVIINREIIGIIISRF